MKQDYAMTLMIHRNSTHGRAPVRDSDLGGLMDTWPELRDVFEEVQFLRQRVEDLVDEVEIQTNTVSELMDELHRDA